MKKYSGMAPTPSRTVSAFAPLNLRRRHKKIMSQLRNRLRDEYLDKCTLHGVSDISRTSSRPIKGLWATIFVCALGAAVYGCYAIVHEYLRSPVVVSYMVQESNHLPLPDIVICPFNRFNRSFFDEHNVSKTTREYLEISFPGRPTLEFMDDIYLKYWVDFEVNIGAVNRELEQLQDKLNVTYTEFLHKATLDCDAFFVKARNSHSPYKLNCSNFETLMTSSGKCYRVPSGNQTEPGFGGGTKVILKIPTELYSPGINQLDIDGVFLKLAERNKGTDMDLTFIPRGVNAILPLKATKYEFMSDPPRYLCVDNKELPSNYSRVSCFDDCRAKAAEKACNCSSAGSINPKKRYCTPAESMVCFNREWGTSNNIGSYVDNCREQCGPSCSYWKFQPTVSYAPFPSPMTEYYLTKDLTNLTLTDLKNYIVIQIFFENMEYTLIKHLESMTIDSFVAQLGGQISLWVGGSILTMVQLIVFLVQLTCPRFFSDRSDKAAAKASVTNPSPSVRGLVVSNNNGYTYSSPLLMNNTYNNPISSSFTSDSHADIPQKRSDTQLRQKANRESSSPFQNGTVNSEALL